MPMPGAARSTDVAPKLLNRANSSFGPVAATADDVVQVVAGRIERLAVDVDALPQDVAVARRGHEQHAGLSRRLDRRPQRRAGAARWPQLAFSTRTFSPYSVRIIVA